MEKFQLFTRTWWDKYGNPQIGRKTNRGTVNSIEAAREACDKFNSNRTASQEKRGYMMEFTRL